MRKVYLVLKENEIGLFLYSQSDESIEKTQNVSIVLFIIIEDLIYDILVC